MKSTVETYRGFDIYETENGYRWEDGILYPSIDAVKDVIDDYCNWREIFYIEKYNRITEQ